ncbi:thermonuclease family protein [Nocardioides campestrisoli]|uniref:thermonuclease family protein n=1 Tax=Nocardioides campestrisoli TaxID=2736757 RepID=UPI00163DDDD1|nr:thermonuclease family protein [Nocardioides campestrisoli]
MRVLALLITVPLALVGLSAPASAGDMDCADFPSQRAAQLFFLANNPAADPHRLDADGDWVVCESNPGPYYYGRDPNPNDPAPPAAPPPPKKKPATLKIVKVVAGDILRLRLGTQQPFEVRLLGLDIAKANSCMTNGARRFLKPKAKPGQVVTLVIDKKAPKRDKQGRLIAEVAKKGQEKKFGLAWDIVSEGWAEVASYKFAAKNRFRSYSRDADANRYGGFGMCVRNYGSARYPYRARTGFEFDGWRYTFGPTDTDALPEMTAEQAAAAPGTYSFTPPVPGATFRRVQVTATRTGSDQAQPANLVPFGYVYGDTAKPITDRAYGSCGTAPNLLNQMNVQPGQTVTGYLCTAKPAADDLMDEMWLVEDMDGLTWRFIALR